MSAALTVRDNADLSRIPTPNLAAYRAYHRATQIRSSPTVNIGERAYAQALREAVELDPRFSRAWAELVSAYALKNFDGNSPQMTGLAEQALAQLKAVAPDSRDYLFGQASYFYYALKDYSRAHDIISRVLEMNPGDVHALEMRSWIERRQGDFDAYLASTREALRLDPRNPAAADGVLLALLYTHRYDEAATELEGRTLESYLSGENRSLLQFRVDRDFSRMQESIEELCRRYDRPDCAWEARIANRQFAQARDALRPKPGAADREMQGPSDRRRLLTDWLTNTAVDPSQFSRPWQLEAQADGESGKDTGRDLLDAAMRAGNQGRPDEAEQLIEAFFSPASLDWALRIGNRHIACRVLAMIEATSATVTCLRDGLTEPSGVVPFYEPYLPFYDRVRDSPEFIRMLAEIDPDAPVNAGK
jgi:tetratricopeptide (TPR) repeat protein